MSSGDRSGFAHEFSRAGREAALRALLAPGRGAVVAALAEDGTRIPLPDSVSLHGHRALPVPQARETLLELLVPDDRIAVVAAWEHARSRRIGVATVRALSDPGTELTLSLVDAHDRYGVWLAVLRRKTEAESGGELLVGPLAVPGRQRQATMHKSMTAVITGVDARVTGMLGWEPAQMLGRRSTEFIHPEDHDRAVAGWMALLSSLRASRIRVRHRRADGGWLWVELENIHNGAEDPDEVDVITHVCDISEEMAAHEQVRRREQLFSRLAECLPAGVLLCSAKGAVLYTNARLCTILQIGRPARAAELFTHVAPGDREAAERALRAALDAGMDGALELEVRPEGAAAGRRCALTVAAVADQDGKPAALVCVDDVTDSARLREELRIRATHDELTGCLNRAAVMHSLEQLLSERDAGGIVAVFVDLDRFKAVNDSFGHATGDLVLNGVARRLQRLAREQDLVGRLGGDEFLLVCRGANLPSGAPKLAERVREALNQPFALPTGMIDLRASIGVAWPQHGTTAQQLIAAADAAMYRSKRACGGETALLAAVER